MDKYEIMKHVDHTNLNPVATWEDIVKLCDEAKKYGAASVCIPPNYVKRVKEQYDDTISICTVIGFPLGFNTVEIKVAEVHQALSHGAQEIDMVINLGDVKNQEFDKITDEISSIKSEIGDKVLKVIIETCYLTEEEIISLCDCINNSGADFIKTSTGFGTSGATYEDIKLIKEYINEDVQIKASGGIRSREQMEKYINLGCRRLGCSSGVSALFEVGDDDDNY